MENGGRGEMPRGAAGGRFARMWRERRAWRPASFYLLFAIPVTLILAAPALYMRENPGRFALHLALLFAFLFVVIVRAAVDCLDIFRKHRSAQRKAFHVLFGARGPANSEGGDEKDKDT